METTKDSVWKEAIEKYFKEFLSLLFPRIGEDIDFDKGYEFLNKELEKIVRGAKTGKRHADLLIKTYLKNVQDVWLLIHIEVQGYADKGFSERMYIYNYRIFDTYKKEVVSLAIVTDASSGFRPHCYETGRWGFSHRFEFPMVKLIDFREKWEELESSDNPFAVVVMAHLKEMETKGDMERRYQWKKSLIRRLYEKGFTRRDILLLYKFIDWLLTLPGAAEKKLYDEIITYEEDQKMPYLTTAERIGMQKGIKEGIKEGKRNNAQDAIIEVLETRFENVPAQLMTRIKKIEDIKTLSTLLKKAVLVKDLEEFEKIFEIIIQL